jgi:hypothetical protein
VIERFVKNEMYEWLIEIYKWPMEMEIIQKWSEEQGPTRGGLALKLKKYVYAHLTTVLFDLIFNLPPLKLV